MNSLEFINLEIAITNTKYKENLKFAQFELAIKDKERLKTLQQIKTELEAWEVVKTKIKFEDLGEMQSGNVYRAYFDDCFDEEEYQKYQKALEVEDEKENKESI